MDELIYLYVFTYLIIISIKKNARRIFANDFHQFLSSVSWRNSCSYRKHGITKLNEKLEKILSWKVFARKNIKSLLLSNKRKIIIAQDIISLYYNYHYIYSFISHSLTRKCWNSFNMHWGGTNWRKNSNRSFLKMYSCIIVIYWSRWIIFINN